MNLEDVNPLAIMPLESSGSLLTKSEMVLLNLINVYVYIYILYYIYIYNIIIYILYYYIYILYLCVCIRIYKLPNVQKIKLV